MVIRKKLLPGFSQQNPPFILLWIFHVVHVLMQNHPMRTKRWESRRRRPEPRLPRYNPKSAREEKTWNTNRHERL